MTSKIDNCQPAIGAKLLLVILFLFAFGQAQIALAYDWNNDYGANVTVSVDDNYRLAREDEIDNTSTRLRLFTDVEGRTEISSIRLTLSVSGEDHSESSIDAQEGYNLALNTSRTGERLSSFLNVAFDSDLTNETELLDTGVIEDGTRDTVSVSPGLSYQLNERNSLSGNLSFQDVSYDTESQIDYTNNSFVLSWSYRLDESSQLYTSLRSSVYEPEDDDETDTNTFSLGYLLQSSEATAYNFSIGYTDVDRPRDSESGGNFLFEADHRTDERNSFTLLLSNSFEDSGQGEVREENNLALGWANGFSERSQFTLSADAVSTDERDYYSVEAGFNYNYSREINLSTSYRYRERDEGAGAADSSTVSFSLSYSPI